MFKKTLLAMASTVSGFGLINTGNLQGWHYFQSAIYRFKRERDDYEVVHLSGTNLEKRKGLIKPSVLIGGTDLIRNDTSVQLYYDHKLKKRIIWIGHNAGQYIHAEHLDEGRYERVTDLHMDLYSTPHTADSADEWMQVIDDYFIGKGF